VMVSAILQSCPASRRHLAESPAWQTAVKAKHFPAVQ
jgi:hypothetical protein